MEVLDSWRGVEKTSPLSEPQAPVWLVGITGTNLTLGDAIFFTSDKPEGAQPIEGIFFAWDANSGALIGQGVLDKQWPQNLGSLSALTSVDTPIEVATIVYAPTETPEPTPTPTPTP